MICGHNYKTLRRLTTFGLLAFLAVGGCSEKQTPAPAGAAKGSRVVIKGSNTIGEELGPRLIAEYKKEHPEAAFDLESKGTGSGFWALVAEQCDLAAASRIPNADELKQAKERNVQFGEHPIGSYSVAVIVNSANPVAGLTREQVRDIFTGAVQNWKDVGGSDAPIHLNIRDPISGTYLGFQELAMENKPYPPGTNALTSYGAIAQAVGQDVNGIGYVSIDLAQKAGLKAVSVGGIAPTAASVNEGKYPYARLLRFYTRKGKEGSPAMDFIKFVQSSRGKEIIGQMGNVPRQ